MLTFRENLFVGESLKGKGEKLIPRIKKGKRLGKGVTMITYAANGRDLFDLIPAKEMKYPVRQKQELYVLGLAGSREEALALVQEMVMEVYRQTGDFDVRGYFGWQ
ncbi:MAG: hypothetical protein K2N63_01805 [Lachnospiraceae bacterium]|nr:hypothetical protein [Lachnospiraceae bacterium]